MQHIKKITLLVAFIGGFFFSFLYKSEVVFAAEEYPCGCFQKFGPVGSDMGARLGNNVKWPTEELCEQSCANLGGKGYCLVTGIINTCTVKEVKKTAEQPGREAFNSKCSCDNGVPQTPIIVDHTPVETREGCIVVCQNAEGATRMKFDALGGGGAGQWESIPAPIGPVIQAEPKKFEYKLLEAFPGFFAKDTAMNTDSKNNFPALILAIYKFGIWTVGIAGLFMLVVGGFMYMASAGNTSTAGNARSMIWDALLGIVAALGAYLIMYVINPDLTTLNLSFTTVKVSEVAAIPSGTMSDADARNLLQQSGVSVAESSGKCTDINNPTCTSLQGIPERTISALINIQNLCKHAVSGCSVVVTGGTETGHQSHGISLPAIDVRTNSALKKYLLDIKNENKLGLINISQICANSANQDVSYRCNFVENADHLHLYFGV